MWTKGIQETILDNKANFWEPAGATAVVQFSFTKIGSESENCRKQFAATYLFLVVAQWEWPDTP